jgi:hypothetical protein
LISFSADSSAVLEVLEEPVVLVLVLVLAAPGLSQVSLAVLAAPVLVVLVVSAPYWVALVAAKLLVLLRAPVLLVRRLPLLLYVYPSALE